MEFVIFGRFANAFHCELAFKKEPLLLVGGFMVLGALGIELIDVIVELLDFL